jgi:6-phosphogluconolactonase (cycloisomerase 2 family)
MSTRSTWLLGVLTLIALAVLMACGSHYSASSDGLVIAPSLGSGVIQAFSFSLSNGHTAQIHTSPAIPGPPSQGSVGAIILDPAGAFAYVTTSNTPNPSTDPCTSTNAIATYKVNSDGTVAAIGSQTFAGLNANNQPVALAMDSAGKFLFVAQSAACVPGDPTSLIAGVVSVFSIGSNAALTEVSGSPFAVPLTIGGATANPRALAVTPTTFPRLNAVCSSGQSVPTTEFLYVVDAANNRVWNFGVDISSGVLGAPGGSGFSTGSVPSGVAVDACNRFVYVTNKNSNNISSYTICNGTTTSSPTCLAQDGSLVEVGTPVSAANGPGPVAVDPLGNYLYVVDQQSNAISGYRISQVAGSLSPLSPATVATGQNPVAITIRADDNWLFVPNYGSASISQYALTPATGALSPAGTGITTDNFPAGVAVK